jgi:hypothetical protein
MECPIGEIHHLEEELRLEKERSIETLKTLMMVVLSCGGEVTISPKIEREFNDSYILYWSIDLDGTKIMKVKK